MDWARGSVDVFYHPQIVENGGLKSEGGKDEPTMTLRLTSMPRPQEIQVGGEHFRRPSHARESGQARKRAARPRMLDALG